MKTKNSPLFRVSVISLTITTLLAAGVHSQTYNGAWNGSGSGSDTSTLDGQVLTVNWTQGTPVWEPNRTFDLSASGFTTFTGTANSWTESEAVGNPALDFFIYEVSLPTGYVFASDLRLIVSGPNSSTGKPSWSFSDFTGLSIVEQRQGGWDGGPVNAASSAYSVIGTDVYIDLATSGEGEAAAILAPTGAVGLNKFTVALYNNGAQTFEEDGFAIYGSAVAVPEPSSAILLGLGYLSIICVRKRTR